MTRLDRDWMTLPDGSKVPRPKRTVVLGDTSPTKDSRDELREIVANIRSGYAYGVARNADELIDLGVKRLEQFIDKAEVQALYQEITNLLLLDYADAIPRSVLIARRDELASIIKASKEGE